MMFEGIEFDERELASLKGFLGDSLGGILLGKALMRVQEEGFEGIRDAGAPIERLRYFQGLLDGLDRFQDIARKLAALDLEGYEEGREDDGFEYTEDVVDVT